MKKIVFKILKYFSIGAASIILVTISINAADHYNNFSDSIIGRMLPDKEKPPCPDDMAYVLKESGGFCIDKYEVSPDESCVYPNVSGQDETRVNLSSQGCFPSSKPGKIPWRFISQTQAQEACAKAGKRLPSGEEWYLASLGTPDKSANWAVDDCQLDSNWDSQPGLSGFGKNCMSAAGAYDMVGNVWEWVREEVQDGYWNDKQLPPQGYIKSVDINGLPLETDLNFGDPNFNGDFLWLKNTGVKGVVRGGYWDNKGEGGLFSFYIVTPPSLVGEGIGFRCAK